MLIKIDTMTIILYFGHTYLFEQYKSEEGVFYYSRKTSLFMFNDTLDYFVT